MRRNTFLIFFCDLCAKRDIVNSIFLKQFLLMMRKDIFIFFTTDINAVHIIYVIFKTVIVIIQRG